MKVSEQESIILGLIDEADNILQNINDIDLSSAQELYEMLNHAVKFTNSNKELLSSMDVRVKLCEYRDLVLDRIVDDLDTSPSIDGEVFAPYHHNWYFWNPDYLLKDTGVAPYIVAKELGVTTNYFFGHEETAYPYLEFLKGSTLITDAYSDDYNKRQRLYEEFIRKNYKKMDVLMLHGPYTEMIMMLEYYRRFRPDGLVYNTLDMSSQWYAKITWKQRNLAFLIENCNMVANSCRYIRDMMNLDPDVSADSFWITNAFYNASNLPIKVEPDSKRNIILTVGRIGSQQKNNEELLLAFANIANVIPDWNIHLVGQVDERIQPFLSQYFSVFPQLKDRVILKGKIANKIELYREYAQAKVFILTSLYEGGTPNVYAEALYHGCVFITSSIDAADDITDYGHLGAKYPLGSVADLSNTLVEMCSKATNIEYIKTHINKALIYANRFFDWHKNGKKIVYALFH